MAKVEIIDIKKGSGPLDEFVILEALQTVGLSGYAIINKPFRQSGVESNKFSHIFIFPNIPITRGDFIHLYTGQGEYTNPKNSAKTLTHKFYWNSSESIWTKGDKALLIKLNVVDKLKL